MEKQEYVEEIELIKEQNNVEFEIYPMAVEIIQPTIKSLSKRYVFARRKSDRGQIYYGLSSFPDVAILDKKFNNVPNTSISEEEWSKLRGCLEVKALYNSLITKKEIRDVLENKPQKLEKEGMGQLIGEILWYKKVLYTNGIEWRYLHIDDYNDKLRDTVITIANNRIKFEKENPKETFDWWESFRNMKFNIVIVDECITENCIENWEDFIDKIQQIDWK
ncbi:hypothetical protein [Ligilactobacillus ruminis]|jgi:hypothetical protein|uniref:hypothetical protein n=1 Tax=Ligilactobacillus ruminis TaxID=1623 RepID=UPI0009BA6DF1|nr:hypothetical protein [Ligilactobacillus ruminis]